MRGARLAAAAVLSLSLLSAPAWAANGLTLSYSPAGNGSAVLSVEGLDGVRDVYAAQVELTLNGSYSDVSLTPSSASTYVPKSTVQTSGGTTSVTLYLYGEEAINRGTSMNLGTLNLGGSFSAPTSATLTLLDWNLSPFGSADHQAVAVKPGGGNGSGSSSSGGDDSEVRYSISVSPSDGGTVRVTPTRAGAGDQVTLTAAPDQGFQLDSLTVLDARGNHIRLTGQDGGRYTFRMPASRVTVEASFRSAGEAADPVPLPFTDVTEAAWYHSAVEYVYRNGLMAGTATTVFSPDVTTTRGMIVTILYRMAGSPTADSGAVSASFPDVPSGQYYTAAVDWAANSGVVTGYTNGCFGPNDPITREQFATILHRYAGLSGLDTATAGDLSAFPDRESVSPYAAGSMGWAVERGLISGMGDGTLAPGGSATRAQAAAILTRYCESVPGA